MAGLQAIQMRHTAARCPGPRSVPYATMQIVVLFSEE
jgi:hypothetical protein